MKLTNAQRYALRGAGLAAICLVSLRGGAIHSMNQSHAVPVAPAAPQVKTPSGEGDAWRPPTDAEAAEGGGVRGA